MEKLQRRNFFKVASAAGMGFVSNLFNPLSRAEFILDSILKKIYPSDSGKVVPGRVPGVLRKPVVIISKRNDAKDKNGNPRAEALRLMFDESIKKLYNVSASGDALKSTFGKDETIGIKVNCLAGRGLSSGRVLVKVIIDSLQSAGIDRERVIVWDRTDDDLARAGFAINRGRGGFRCFGTNSDYEREPEISGSVGSCFSRILTEKCSSIINVPVLKDHDLAGVSLGMKNFYGAIHNPNKYHDDACNPYAAELNMHPFIKDKLRLTVCDGITAQYHGGPSYKPQWTWDFNGILVSEDPVAIDRIGCDIIVDKRREAGLKTFSEEKREPKYIETAGELGLGVFDKSKIKIINL